MAPALLATIWWLGVGRKQLVLGFLMQPLEGLLAMGSQSAVPTMLLWTLGAVSQRRSDLFAITSHRFIKSQKC
jgi:hypothetical protein